MRKSLPIFTLALVILAVGSTAFADSAPSSAGVVNINTADAAQLSLLPRVGAAAAKRIIDYRAEHGPFKKATDLMQVKGIGAKTYEGLAQYVAIDGKTTLTTKVSSPRKPRAKQPASQASN